MPGKPKAAPEPVPVFTSDRMRLLGEAVTGEIVTMARQRVVTGESLFYHDKLRPGIDALAGKLALILVLEINPRELLDNNEQGLLRGTTRKTYAEMLAAGEIAP